MARKSTNKKKSASSFIINNYKILEDNKDKYLIMDGQKLPPPSKRITLRQKNIKVLAAKIIYKYQKGDIEFEVARINRIKSFGEVRIHTNSVLYPGNYHVTLQYTGELNEEALKKQYP